MKKSFPTPYNLKQYCGLERKDKITLDMISKIEEKLDNYKINVMVFINMYL